MRLLLKNILGSILGNNLSFRLFRAAGRKSLLILYYHRVAKREEIMRIKEINICTDIDSFDAQIGFISKYYNSVNEEKIISGKITDYSVWVTFDDGYKDNYTNAYPILRKYNIPATFFITTGYINKTNKPSADCGEPDFMSWEELSEVARNNISIGAHTVSHRILSRLLDSELEKEIIGSKNEIEKRLDVKVVSFAYPRGKTGDYNLEKCQPILEENGFKLAVTTNGGFNKIGRDNFDLRRMGISYEDNLNIFKFKVSLGSFWQR